MKFLSPVKFEKDNMNRIRFVVNYVIAPVFFLLFIACLVLIGVFMSIDEQKYTPLAIILFCFLGLLSVLFLLSVPFVRNREIEIELSKYNFEDEFPQDKKEYKFLVENNDLIVLNEFGAQLREEFFWYNHMKLSVVTARALNRIVIAIVLEIEDSDPVTIPFNSMSLHMIDQFNLRIENREVLDYIVKNKRSAFKQIYLYGKIKTLE